MIAAAIAYSYFVFPPSELYIAYDDKNKAYNPEEKVSIIITVKASPKFEHNKGVNNILNVDPPIIVIKLMICVYNGVIPKLFFQNIAYYLTPIIVEPLITL
eukprot:Mrub_03811.p4 GENE.Mrub_03811~~Mrub_03811.p4  ORF type:complete len:101 (+),score=8.32 Mrub_03811:376-678(+)